MSFKIGILGGVGPEATADVFKKIIKATSAKIDQDHIETIIISNPKIPDRTNAILYGGESPIAEMLKTAKTLEALQVNCIVIPCNTAHYYFAPLQKEISIPIINLIKETVEHIKLNYPFVTKVGLLATTGTIVSKIYDKELAKSGIEIIHVDEDIQENFVMEAIYSPKGIKAGFKIKPRALLKYAAMHLHSKGAQIIIKGCTEIALVLTKKNCPQILVDPAKIVAKKIVSEAELYNKSQIYEENIISEEIKVIR